MSKKLVYHFRQLGYTEKQRSEIKEYVAKECIFSFWLGVIICFIFIGLLLIIL